MDGTRDYHTEWSYVRKRKTNITYVESKICHKWTYLKNRNQLTDIENRFVVAKGEWVGEEKDESLGSAEANYYIYRIDKQQGPTV